MQALVVGHVYELAHLDGEGTQKLLFVNREDTPHEGTTTQEVIRVLIDRTQHCDRCLRWEGNDLIIQHLRMVLVLHETRALLRKVEKGEMLPEEIALGDDGHFDLKVRVRSGL